MNNGKEENKAKKPFTGMGGAPTARPLLPNPSARKDRAQKFFCWMSLFSLDRNRSRCSGPMSCGKMSAFTRAVNYWESFWVWTYTLGQLSTHCLSRAGVRVGSPIAWRFPLSQFISCGKSVESNWRASWHRPV